MSIAADVVSLASQRGWTVATAESLTGGLVAAAIVSVPGASAVFAGGVVAYSAATKVSALGLDPDALARDGVVSAATALAMARGVRALMGTDAAIATTGVAGPEPLEGHKPGTGWIAVSVGAAAEVRQFSVDGSRDQVRDAVTTQALALAREVMRNTLTATGTTVG